MQLVETKLPEFPYGPVLSAHSSAAEEASIFEPLIASGKVDELADAAQIAGLKASLDMPAKDYLKAMRIRRLMQEEFSQAVRRGGRAGDAGPAGPATQVDQRLDCARPTAAPPQDSGHHAGGQSGGAAGAGVALRLRRTICRSRCKWWARRFRRTRCWPSASEFQSHTDWHKRRPPVA